MNRYMGYDIVINDMTYTVPNRTLSPKNWHFQRCYALRVQKKWIRRFGTHQEPVLKNGEIYTARRENKMVMNSPTFQELKAKIAARGPQ